MQSEDAPGIGSGSAEVAVDGVDDVAVVDDDDVNDVGASRANLVRIASLIGDDSR